MGGLNRLRSHIDSHAAACRRSSKQWPEIQQHVSCLEQAAGGGTAETKRARFGRVAGARARPGRGRARSARARTSARRGARRACQFALPCRRRSACRAADVLHSELGGDRHDKLARRVNRRAHRDGRPRRPLARRRGCSCAHGATRAKSMRFLFGEGALPRLSSLNLPPPPPAPSATAAEPAPPRFYTGYAAAAFVAASARARRAPPPLVLAAVPPRASLYAAHASALCQSTRTGPSARAQRSRRPRSRYECE